MFESLPFSRPATRQPLGHAVTAMSVHGALAVAAILGTRQVMEQPAPDGRDIILTPFVADPAPRAQTPASSDPLPVLAAPTAPSLPTVSVDVPTSVPVGMAAPGPVVDLSSLIDRTAVLSPTPGGSGDGGRIGDAVYTQNLVDVPVELLDGPTPAYPTVLAGAGLAGRVVLEFVVDTLGQVEPASIRMVEGAHPAFEASARAAISAARFRPARAKDHAVRQRVRQAVRFVPTQG